MQKLIPETETITHKVYILTNEAFPKWVKIGYTQDIKNRLRQLYKTGTPLPFRCHFAVAFKTKKEAREIENLMHEAYQQKRINKDREFFDLTPEAAVAALSISKAPVVAVDNKAIDEKGNEIPYQEEKTGHTFSFKSVHIPIDKNIELTFTRNPAKKCVVINDHEVEYKGKPYSLSKLAKKWMGELGYNWGFYRGPLFFLYENETLHDRKNRFDKPKPEQPELPGITNTKNKAKKVLV